MQTVHLPSKGTGVAGRDDPTTSAMVLDMAPVHFGPDAHGRSNVAHILTMPVTSAKIESMSTEQVAELEIRVAVHAALADPARLTIVDTLTVGDISPSELSALLCMPSNLVSHHVNVLEAVGIVARTPSEGDRRRTYLRLVPGSLRDVATRPPRRAPRLLFICTANSARSHLAAALWRGASPVPAASAGTRPAHQIDPRAIAAAERHGLSLRRLRPRAIDDVHIDGDVVVTVCDRAHEELAPLADIHWSVPDPVEIGSDAAFDRAFDDLTRRVGDLAPLVTKPRPEVRK